MFLSAVWTLILTAPIHCRASIAEQVMYCYISPRNKLIYILNDPRVSTFSSLDELFLQYTIVYTMSLVSLVSLSQVFVHAHTKQRRIVLTKQMVTPRRAHAMWMTFMVFFVFWSLTTSFSYENTSEKYLCLSSMQ